MRKLGVRFWRFLKPMLIASLIVAAAVALSFVWWGSISVGSYSDRLFWAGIASIAAGRIAHERVAEQLSMNSRRYTWALYPIVTGLLCMGISAVIQILGA